MICMCFYHASNTYACENVVEPLPRCNAASNILDVQRYLCDRKLKLNVDKSRQMIIPHCHVVADTNINMKLVRQIKILGIYWEDSLTWDLHFNYILKTAAKRLYVLRVLKPFLSKSELFNVYNSLIVSVFMYASPLLWWLPLLTSCVSFKIAYID